jgi:hypothetical protein
MGGFSPKCLSRIEMPSPYTKNTGEMYMNFIFAFVLIVIASIFFGKREEPLPPIAHYTIGDLHFAIPTYYRYLSPPTQVEPGVILAFLWPSLDPRSTNNIGEFSLPGGGRKVQILIEPDRYWKNIESRYDFSTIKHVKGDLYSIATPKLLSWDDRRHFVAHPTDPANRSFINASNGPSPQCIQRAHYKTVSLKITYRCVYFDEWEKIHREIKKLLDEWSKHS